MTFSISLVGAVIACSLGRFDTQFINTKVIISLFGLMIVIEALKEMGTLTRIAHLATLVANSKRSLVQLLVALSFFASMLLTNDVTILTVLPIFLMIAKQVLARRETLLGTVLIILAANLGSSAFPTGSPHNIFLYSYYHLNVQTFFSWMWLFCLLSAVMLWRLSLLVAKEPFNKEATQQTALHVLAAGSPQQADGFNPPSPIKAPLATNTHPKVEASSVASTSSASPVLHQHVPFLKRYSPSPQKFLPYAGLLIMLAHVMNFAHSPWWVVVAVVLVLVQFPHAIKKVDYLMLLTFVCFFLIVGNLSQNHSIADFLRNGVQSYKDTLWVSAGVSQVISNVPASLLLAPFTKHAQAMVIGANIGGMGTLIASLANLIGYKVFASYYPKEKTSLLKWFSAINFALLGIYLAIFSVI
ncbi:SLC13 family permease [Pelistega europaea]|uniref:Citrate transporter-like domain-containing protein n=1 Tax=Pelistega europaea TaxID=106147 RepID=A0A7Y4LCD6_9BURK|nr:SLC13 family permease [Pelistega europaea]NOL49691.1 hypothetical protein [Pelistega europaea]